MAHQGRQLGQLRPGPGQGRQGWAAGLGQQGGQLGQPFEPIGQGHQVPGGGAACPCPTCKPFQVAHGPQQPAQGLAQGALVHQFAHPVLTGADGGPIDQGRLDPAAQAAAAHGRDGAIEGPQQGPLDAPAQLGTGEFQVAAGLGIEHQLVARMPGGGQVQGDGGARLGVVEVAQQPAGGPLAQGQVGQAQARQAGQLEALQQARSGLRPGEGGEGRGRQPQAFGTPAGAVPLAGPDHFGGVQLQQLLVQQVAALAFRHPEFAGADVRHRQAPTAALHHDSAEPVVAPRREHPLLDHRAGGEHPGDVALEQGPFCSGGFELVAEGHTQTAAHQVAAVALGRVVGNARHRHPPVGLARLLAREGELQQLGERDRVFKEAFEKIAEPVEQQPLGMGGLELHVVAQHRRQLKRIH